MRLFLFLHEDSLKAFHKNILVGWLANHYIFSIDLLERRVKAVDDLSSREGRSLKNELKEAKIDLSTFMEEFSDYLIESLMYQLLSSFG